MSPRKLTRSGSIVAGICVAGSIAMILIRPDWGWLAWWPVVGLGLAFVLWVAAFLRGAYLTSQERVRMVDLLNDCYTGVPENQGRVD